MQVIHTIGTQDRHDEDFLAVLREHRIDAVIDIRVYCEGRYYRFASGQHIKELVEGAGIAYLHDRRFAPTAEIRDMAEQKDWVTYEAAYRALITERHMAEVWQEVTATFGRPCLLCAERSADHCHRRLLGEALVTASREGGVTLVHIPAWKKPPKGAG